MFEASDEIATKFPFELSREPLSAILSTYFLRPYREGTGGLEYGTRVLERVAHSRANLVVTHNHDIIDELVAQAEDL